MADKYDEQIERLRNTPELIYSDWDYGIGLFASVCDQCGCLTQVRRSDFWGENFPDRGVLAEIVADERIPKNGQDVTVDHLPVFAQWQRKIDAMGIR